MVNSGFLICSLTSFLFVTGIKSYILNNDLMSRDYGKDDVEQLELVSSLNSYEDNRDGANKITKLLMNPITDDNVDITDESSADTDSSDVIVLSDRTSVTPARRNFLTNLLSQGIRAVAWRIAKFFMCALSPLVCTVMNVLSDEVEGESLNTPEDVARGLRFIEDIIEVYHSGVKRSV